MSRQPAPNNAGPRPGRLLRWFFRAPVALYRVGLGWLMFGQLQLTTTGRKSGLPRRTVVDILRHDDTTDTYYVVSAYGVTSDWYRNLLANPKVTMEVGRRAFPAHARVLPEGEAEEMFLDFWRRHRLYVSTMLRLIGLKVGSEDEARAAAAGMRTVAIQPVPGD